MTDASLQVAISADTTKLTANLAIAKVAFQEQQAELTKLVKASAAASDELKAGLKPALLQAAEAAASGKAQVAYLTRGLKEHATSVGTNRVAYLEFGHVVKSAFDELGAGASPLQVLKTEGARAVQAFTELNATTATTILRFGAVAAPVLAAGAAIAYVAVQVMEAKTAIGELNDQTSYIGRSAEAASGQTEGAVRSVAHEYRLAVPAVADLGKAIYTIPGLTQASKDALLGLVPAIAAASHEESDKAAEGIANSFRTIDGIERIMTANQLVSAGYYDQLKAAKENGNYLTAQRIGVEALTESIGKQKTAMQSVAEQNQYRGNGFRSFGEVADNKPLAQPKPEFTIPEGVSDQQQNIQRELDALGKYKTEAAQIADLQQRQATAGAIIAKNSGADAAEIARAKDAYAAIGEQITRIQQKEDRGNGGNVVQTMQVQLTSQLLAVKKYGADRDQIEVQFWQQKLATIKGDGAQEVAARREINDRILQATDQLHSAEVASAKHATAQKNSDAKNALAEQRAMDNNDLQTKLQVERDGVDQQRSLLDDMVATHKITADQRATIEANLIKQEADLDAQLLTAQSALDDQSVVKKHAIANQIVAIYAKRDRDIQAGSTVAAKADVATAQSAAEKIRQQDKTTAASAAQSIVGMLSGRQSFAQAAVQIGEQMLEHTIETNLISALDTIRGVTVQTAAVAAGGQAQVAAKAAAAVEGVAVQKAVNSTTVLGAAKTAAANTYASIAAIPIIGPELAPFAAAAAFAATLVFSSQGGMDRVPYDNAPFLLHKNETVLSAPLADRVRNMTKNNNRGGDFHMNGDINVHATPGMDEYALAQSVVRQLKNMHRNGHFSGL